MQSIVSQRSASVARRPVSRSGLQQFRPLLERLEDRNSPSSALDLLLSPFPTEFLATPEAPSSSTLAMAPDADNASPSEEAAAVVVVGAPVAATPGIVGEVYLAGGEDSAGEGDIANLAGMNPPPGNNAPIILDFGYIQDNPYYTFEGKVQGNPSGGILVEFDGIPCLEGEYTYTDANGDFTLTVTYGPEDHGFASAIATQNGQGSAAAWIQVP